MVRGLFIAGTDTGIGKTLVATLLTRGLLDRGVPAIHFKPVQSGFVSFRGKEFPADLLFSWSLVAPDEDPADYCAKRSLYAFREAIAPDHAAEKEQVAIDVAAIVARAGQLAKEHFLVTEGAGGIAVPLGAGLLMSDLIAALKMPTVVVTRAGLGTLNHTRLTLEFLRQRGIAVAGIVVSGYDKDDPTATRNLQQLPVMNDVPLLGVVPRILGLDTERPGWLTAETINSLIKVFDWDAVIKGVNT